ncbi:MAG: hypothetical protein ACRCXT_08925 [Paraclostridium sp.]
MYKFSGHSRYILNLDKVVVGNRETGQWIRISKEVYDILKLGIDHNISIDDLKLSHSNIKITYKYWKYLC